MMLAIIVFLGGALTILSPCILPVLPFVFARAGQSFWKSVFPMLLGLGLTFSVFAALAATSGAWVIQANQYGRAIALLLLAGFAVSLISTTVADWLARPFVALGQRLLQRGDGDSVKQSESESEAEGKGALPSVMLGVATGLLWAPCAGPVLGLVLTGAALSGPTMQTVSLLLIFAAGAVSSLALASLAGAKISAMLKRSLGAGVWLRRAAGVTVALAVVTMTLGWERYIPANLLFSGTDNIEQAMVESLPAAALNADHSTNTKARAQPDDATAQLLQIASLPTLPVEGTMPALDGASLWLNSPALSKESLRGKVVLVAFWTYSCINCQHVAPYVKAWNAKYKDHGLVVIGVHTPEFAFEKDKGNVRNALTDMGITYPVAMDNDFTIWRAFNNRYWPAHYFVDANGKIRHHHFGEGSYKESEQTIRQLLIEAGNQNLPPADQATASTLMHHHDMQIASVARHFAELASTASKRPSAQ